MRVVGGRFSGRILASPPGRALRPSSERVREAVFNILEHGVDAFTIEGTRVLDLFAGTGALGLEAISRGAARATFIERHFPTANLIRKNAQELGCPDQVDVAGSDTFFWAAHERVAGDVPWVVFCSPPYDLYVERNADMLALLNGLADSAPPQSVFVVEADGRFDTTQLPSRLSWDVREYLPAVVAIGEREA